MKIKYAKINTFGNLKNKEINFNNNINIIYGKNETGKSTLLKFIFGIFFGISKNKKRKEISDFEKYYPWDNSDFSWKLIYELDNKEKYEIFREFNKKNINIFNEKSEDISNKYSINKENGNAFFVEQTKVDEDLFLNTAISLQEEIKLDKTEQVTLLQKITNIVTSGDDSVSFKKVIDKLNKKAVEEVGNNKTKNKPINIIEDKIKELKRNEYDIEIINEKIRMLEENKIEINNNMLNNEIKIDLLKKIKNKKEEEKIEEEKIKLNTEIVDGFNEQINDINNKINNIEKNKSSSRKGNLINKILFIPILIINIISFIYFKNIYSLIINIILDSLMFIYYLIYFTKKIKNKNKINNDKNNLINEIKILKENRDKKTEEIKILETKFNSNKNENNKIIIEKYYQDFNMTEINNFLELKLNEINDEIERAERNVQGNKIKVHEKEIDRNNQVELIEKQLYIKEKIGMLEEEKQELLEYERVINITKSEIEEAYAEMKNNVTPKFTKQLSKLISQITSGKYNNLKYNDEQGLVIELENGNYANTNLLSIGTIDQMYLALRLSAIQEVTQEHMPIILDESFSMTDDERLKNILMFLNYSYKENQKLIFTCTKREINILNDLGIEYNLIEL